MDNDLLDLADRLSTIAGMIMEDHNPIAVSTPRTPEERIQRLDALGTAGHDIAALAHAAKVLVRLA